jgi:hypothetical protein
VKDMNIVKYFSDKFAMNVNDISFLKQNFTDISHTIKEAFYNANNDLTKQKFDIKNSGSTVCMLFLYGNKLICANVGDSRAIICSCSSSFNWKVAQLTQDHKPTNVNEMKRIEQAGGIVERCKYEDNDKEYENNRIEEGYELFLKDVEGLDEDYEPETEFYTGGLIFENKDYKVRLKLPSNICAGQYVKVDLCVEKQSDDRATLDYEGILQIPSLCTIDGEHELKIRLDNIALEMGQKIVQEYWLLAQTEALPDTSIMLKSGSGRASVNGIEQPTVTQLNCKIAIVDEEADRLSARQTGNVNIELRGMKNSVDYIKLAKISIVKTGVAYLIEAVNENGVKKYIPTLRDTWKRMEYS